jgi:hypothetical protein
MRRVVTKNPEEGRPLALGLVRFVVHKFGVAEIEKPSTK